MTRPLLRAVYRQFAAALAVAVLAVPAFAQKNTDGNDEDAPAAARNTPPSASAQRVYDAARDRLLQIRTLLRGQDSQASTGSGFIVSTDGHAITNYHVVSQAALQPKRYRLVYVGTDGEQGTLQLLAFDALHDLALIKLVPNAKGAVAPHARTPLTFRPRASAVARGERIYSLGYPLDVGFALHEGTYNGLVERSFYPNIFFGGALNPGMSGGPAVDANGRIIGINVAARIDGQSVSFLVPAEYAEDLLARSKDAKPITQAVYPEITRQLLIHQDQLTARLLAMQWRDSGHERYNIPVPQEDFMRCWGRSTPAETKGLQFERSDCEMNNEVFVSGQLRTGGFSARHEAYDGSKLGTLRFTRQYSGSFRNEWFGGDRQRTPPQCHERYVDRDGLPLRVVTCMTAYRKLHGLYDLSVLVATLDESQMGAQGRMDVHGVSFDNALKLTDHYLRGYGWMNASH